MAYSTHSGLVPRKDILTEVVEALDCKEDTPYMPVLVRIAIALERLADQNEAK